MNNVSQQQEKIYFGLDISQKTIEIFVLKGEKGVSFGKISNTPKSLNEFFDKVPVPSESIVVALETGTHSAWISRLLEARGYDVIVAHARDFVGFQRRRNGKADRFFCPAFVSNNKMGGYGVKVAIHALNRGIKGL